MDNSLLLTAIAKYVTLDAAEQDQLIDRLHYKKVKRRQFVLEEGEVHNKVIFVTAGCLRSYAVDKNGTEHVLQFAPPGWWIVDMRSFVSGKPAMLNIDAIEDSEYIYINKADFDELNQQLPKFETFNRILGQNAIATYQYRQIDNVTLSAIERYSNFCGLYPSLIKSLPQKQVASYIGVTPEFLSKMLNNTIVK
ncbi:Crp/Fnr family transcriptional regulator [Mucilaginibacter pallidiroseus]|uniref:Crp/Fnr family transcriptional regulator n=1 Tax=Mucilaginibacter pallidiroseus TaxID=2599295 RepID=A0A563UI93_9SPHI|nr:Crp/Fnr family transcriptional regulator [Mucilaginibacter pallidiroseus]TWR30978.1 Crp/Fnr family transcriptional regulator [Mucilaginibacter pallidiroseus]